jgi:hypothetical protein
MTLIGSAKGKKGIFLAAFALSWFSLAAIAQSAAGGAGPVAAKSSPASGGHSHFASERFPIRARLYYQGVFGVDGLVVRQVEAGEMIRFSYRVLDPNKAKVLNDKKYQPELIDPQAGVKLSVPSLEKVGQLRQSVTPEAGKSYWMAFSNKGRLVKRGDHVEIVIGTFHATGLVVD